MTDIAMIDAVASSIKSAIDIAKAIKDTDISLEKAELKMQMADLIGALADAKIAAAEITGTLIDKDREIENLKSQLEFRGSLIRCNEAYFETDESGNPVDDPYCPHCWEVKQQAVHLTTDRQYTALMTCTSCGVQYRENRVRLKQDG